MEMWYVIYIIQKAMVRVGGEKMQAHPHTTNTLSFTSDKFNISTST